MAVSYSGQYYRFSICQGEFDSRCGYHKIGQVDKWLKWLDCKSNGFGLREFESLSAHWVKRANENHDKVMCEQFRYNQRFTLIAIKVIAKATQEIDVQLTETLISIWSIKPCW